MKLIHMISAAAVSLAFAGTALAKEPSKVVVQTDLNVVSTPEPGYPYLAQRASLSGSCQLTADIDHGKVAAVRVLSCTSGLFHNEALRTARGMSFAPDVSRADAGMEIRWMAAPSKADRLMVASRD